MMAAMSDDDLLEQEDAAAYLRKAPRTLEQWRHQGRGPAYSKSGRTVLYRRRDLDAWVDANRVEPRSQGPQ